MVKVIRWAIMAFALTALVAMSPGVLAADQAPAPAKAIAPQATTPNLCIPTSGRITQRFATHGALDIAGGKPAGTAPVYAAHAGRVVYVGPMHANCTYNYAVAIRYNGQINGKYILTYYNHMGHWDGKKFTSYVKVAVGSQVDKGQLLGYQGDAPKGICGTATPGVHAHIGLFEGSQPFLDRYTSWAKVCSRTDLYFETGGKGVNCSLKNPAKAADPELPQYMGKLPSSVVTNCSVRR